MKRPHLIACMLAIDGVLSSDALDSKLATCAVLTSATPRGLAEFVQQGPDKKRLIDYLLGHPDLMKEMLCAGGAKAARYGVPMDILTRIMSASPRAKDGHFRRLAGARGVGAVLGGLGAETRAVRKTR